MNIPNDTQTYEMSSSIIWIKGGIVYSKPKNVTPRKITGVQIQQEMIKFKAIVGNEKVCMVVQINP